VRVFIVGLACLPAIAPLSLVHAAGDSENKLTSGKVKDFSAQNNNKELIVAVLLRKQIPLSDGMLAQVINGDIALPFEQFMFLVEFPIKVDASLKTAAGWFIRENRRFSMNLETGVVNANGKVFKLVPSQFKVVDGEIYIPTKLLAQWFPLTIDSNLRALEVTVTPKESIAVDERIERKKRKFGSVYEVYARNPEHKTPYKAFSVPSVSVNFGVGYNDSKDIGANGNFSLRAYGDLAYMSGSLALLGDQDEVTDARFTLSRHNPRGGLLGALNATSIEFGDISGSGLPLVSGSLGGRGIRLARRPAGYVGNQEKVTLEGLLETGYSIELYRNNILINAQQTGSGSRYEFKDLELFTGQNEFRVEFYGPQGQRDTQIKRYYAGGSQLKKGEINYDIGLSQPERTVFDVGSSSNQDSVAASARLSYGVSSALTASLGIARLPITSTNKIMQYGFIGASTQYAGVIGSLDIVTDYQGGLAWSVGASGKKKIVDYSAKYSQYNEDFSSNRSVDESTGQKVASTLQLNADIRALQVKKGYFSVGARATLTKYTNDEWNRQLGLTFSGQLKGTMLANTLSYSDFSIGNESTLTGQSLLNTRFGKLNLRLGADYELQPERELRQLRAGLSYPLKNNYQATVAYKRDYLAGNELESITAGISKQFKFATVGLLATHNSYANNPDDKSLLLTVSFGTFTDSKRRGTRLLNKSTTLGASRVKAFIDADRDGVFDIGETPVADVNIGGYNTTQAKTDSNGEALITTSFYGDWTDLYLDSGSMPQAGLSPANSGLSVLNRPGVVSEIPLPIVKTADVEGSVSLLRSNQSKEIPLGNLEIQAVQINPNNNKPSVVASVLTSFDGFYSLPNVPIGATELRINPEQLKRLAASVKQTIKLTITAKDDLIANQNFILRR